MYLLKYWINFVLYFNLFVHCKGHFVRALGKIGDKETENEVLLLEHDVPCSNFTEAVISCLPTMPWKITPKVCSLYLFMY